MGTLAEGSCASRFSQGHVLLTGSARYDNIRFDPRDQTGLLRSADITASDIMACSLEVELEVLMVEAACLAARGLPGHGVAGSQSSLQPGRWPIPVLAPTGRGGD